MTDAPATIAARVTALTAFPAAHRVSARVRGEDIYSRATNYHWKRRFEGGVPTPSEKESQWLSLLSLGLACETERKLKGNPLYERLTTATLGMHGPTACLEALQQCGYQVSTTHCCLADAKRVFAFQMLHVATITSKDRGPPQDRLNPKAVRSSSPPLVVLDHGHASVCGSILVY